MDKVLNVYKPAGMTPLEAVKAFQNRHPEYENIKMTYAGRLDPLAEGVLLVLVGDELKKQEKYWGLDKEYEAQILLGFATDTYDILGIPRISRSEEFRTLGALEAQTGLAPEGRQVRGSGGEPLERADRGPRDEDSSDLIETLKEFQGEYTFSFPPYSSRRVEGKPLFWWARNGRLDEIEIPQKTVQIYKIGLVDKTDIKKEGLLEQVVEKVDSVQGDFRQEQIKQKWEEVLEETQTEKFPVLKIKVSCSSGTYIRSIAHDIGKKTGVGGILMHLKRTRVEKYGIEDSIQIDNL